MTLPAAPSFADYISSRNAHRQTCLLESQVSAVIEAAEHEAGNAKDSLEMQKITADHLPVLEAPLAFSQGLPSCDAGYLAPARPRRLLTSAGSAPTRAIPDFYNQLNELVDCFQHKPQAAKNQGKRAQSFVANQPYYLRAQAQKRKTFWLAELGKKFKKFYKAKLKDLAKLIDALAVA